MWADGQTGQVQPNQPIVNTILWELFPTVLLAKMTAQAHDSVD